MFDRSLTVLPILRLTAGITTNARFRRNLGDANLALRPPLLLAFRSDVGFHFLLTSSGVQRCRSTPHPWRGFLQAPFEQPAAISRRMSRSCAAHSVPACSLAAGDVKCLCARAGFVDESPQHQATADRMRR